MILLIDNYDSFSYNLYQLIGTMDPDVRVVRNDELTVGEVQALAPDGIVISPGPGRPADAGICEDVVRQLGGQVPILGVCLGHQAICEALGGVVTYAPELMHGKASVVEQAGAPRLFSGLPQAFEVARYHSLVADEKSLPACLYVSARVVGSGEVMAVEHREHATFGLQFHPESILTPDGGAMVQNFIDICHAR